MKKRFAGARKKTAYAAIIIKTILLFICLHIYNYKATSQPRFPVSSRTIIHSPYSPSLSDYYTGTDPKLQLIVTNTDLRQPIIRARLQLNIISNKVNIRSRSFIGPIIELDAGVPNFLSGMDLAVYFNPSNIEILSGLDYNTLFKSFRLPDGTYTIRFDVIEAFTGQVLNDIKAFQPPVNILSNDPPFLNLPRKGDNIRFTDPLNIIFNWTPRALIKGTTEYEFSLYEIYDNGMPPENAPFMSQPIYQTTTQTTTLLYGPTEPPLLPGKKYAWRIRAIAKQGIEIYNIYNNDGYTETFWFQLNDNCNPIQQIAATVRGGAVTLQWPENPSMYEYTVEYRKKGDWNRWFSTTTKTNKVIITDVSAGNTYEYRVGGTCTIGAGATFSDIRAFTIPPRDSVRDKQCGILPNINLTNQKILENLGVGESVMVGDFPATILNVRADGNGSFSGTAALKMDIFRIAEASIKTTFNSVVFNTDKQLIKGFFVTTYDSTGKQIVDLDEVFEGGGDVGKVKDGRDTADITVNFPIHNPTDITVKFNPTDSTIVINITGPNGETKQIPTDHLPTTIKDSEGNIYNVDKDGKVTKVGKTGEFKGLDFKQFNTIATDKATVTFTAHPKQQYAFDEWKDVYNKSQIFTKEYQDLNGYRVSSKAIEAAKTDIVKATIVIKDNSIKPDSVKFVTGKGTRFESKYVGNNEYEITIIGGPSKDAQELYAIYPTINNNYLSLGKLLISSYPHQKQKLVLVSVNKTPVDKNKIADSLNAIYKKVAVEFDIQSDAFDDKSWDIDKDGALQVDGSGLFSTLTDEMKALNDAYRRKRTIDKSTIYLFVLPKASQSGVVGDMPRNKQFGYLFSSDGKTAAHEIGHGLYHLKHTFDGYFNGTDLSSSKNPIPNNVMSYPNGDQFTKLQWDEIHNPGLVIGLFESDGDAMLQAGIYWNPAGYPVKISSTTAHGIIDINGIEAGTKINGILYGWEDESIKYEAKIENGLFKGYYPKSSTSIYNDGLKLNVGNKVDVISLMYTGNCSVNYISNNYTIPKIPPTISDYKNGIPIISAFTYTNGKIIIKNNPIADCGSGSTIKDGTLAKEFYTIHLSKATDSAAKKELQKLALLVDTLGRDLYNTYIEEVKQYYDVYNYWWLDFPMRYANKSFSAEDVQKAYQKLEAFYKAIQKLQTGTFNNKQEIIDLVNTYFVAGGSQIKYFFTAPFKTLSAKQRIALLQHFLQGSMPGRLSIAGDVQEEDIVLAIFQEVPAESTQPQELLTALKDRKWLYNFVDGMNGDNFNKFITKLTEWVLKVYPAPKDNTTETEKIFQDKRYVLFNDNFFGRRNTEKIYSDGNIHLLVKRWFSASGEYEINCSPYDYIAVTFKNDFSVDNNAGFAKGETYKLPAIFVYMLFNEDTKNKWFKSGKIGLDVALLALGAGEIKAAVQSANWLRTGLAIADIGIGFGDIIINTAFENEVKQKYPEFYSVWQKISFCYGIGRLTQVGIEAAVKKCYNESKLIQVDAMLSEETKNTAKQIQNKIEQEKELAGMIVNNAGDIAIDVANATEKQLDDIFAGLQNNPPFKYAPNTLEHKAERWAQYKIEKGAAAKDYSNWSNIYNSNMTKARTAHQAADDIMASIGWGQREVTVQAGTYTRRMDIADVNLRKGVEVKSYETSKVYATQAIKGELNADKFLVKMQNWQIEWVFKGCEPSQPLRTLLEQAGITIKLIP